MNTENDPQPLISRLNRSNIETIDTAFFKFIDEELNLHCTTSEGFKKVPVIWANSERAYQIKNNINLRDENGSLIPPIVSVVRKSITKDLSKKGIFQANLAPKNNRVVFSEEINQDKTSNFANADTLKRQGQLNFITSKKNTKKVYKYRSILMPVYVTVDYEIHVLASYVQQINEIIQPFMTRTAGLNYFVIQHESFRYECFIQQDFSQETEISADDEKKHKSVLTIKVLGQLVGDDVNQDISTEKTTENAVEVKIPRENLLFIEESDKKLRKKFESSSEGIQVSSGLLQKKVFLIGGGTNSVYTVTHNFGSRDILVFVRSTTAPYSTAIVNIDYTTLNHIEIEMGDAVAPESYSVTVLG